MIAYSIFVLLLSSSVLVLSLIQIQTKTKIRDKIPDLFSGFGNVPLII